MIRGVLFDLAGVIYEGEKALPGALKAVDRLRHAGLSLRFVTNTTRTTKSMVLQRLSRLGLDVTDSELFTPAQREWLARNDCSPSLLVHPNLVQEFEDFPIHAHRAVVVGDAGEAFCYASLKLCRRLRQRRKCNATSRIRLCQKGHVKAPVARPGKVRSAWVG